MRKLYPILSGIFLVLLFTSCKQFTTNIDDYLTYWSSESYVNAHAVRTVHYNDKDNTLSVPSASDVTVMLTVHNPKNFSLAMPTSSADAGKIIRFPALSPQPVHGTDYILTQTANDKLNLTYKSSFLQAHEWGARDIGAEITLSSKDGRTFKQNYRFKIRANTPPKLSYVTIGKTKDHDSSGKYYYVIILKAANMTKTAGTASELLHKDIKTLLITGKDPADIAFTTGNTGFTTNGRLLASAEVAQLGPTDLIGSAVLPNWDTALVNDPWALRYKTDTEVQTAEQIYKFKLGDEKGLVSNEISVSTAKTQVQDVRLFYNASDISAQAGNFSTPYSINVEESATSITVTAKTEIAGAKITGEVEKWDGTTWTSVSDIDSGAQNEVSIPLPTPTGSVQDILYKISVAAGGDGFAAGTVNTFYVNVTKSVTVTINGAELNAWKTLRNTVGSLRAGSTIIVNGEIKATSDPGNSGEIIINKNLTIKGSNKTTDKLNANKTEGHKQGHRIFKVESGATLTLSGLTLKGGIGAVGGQGGGGIYAEGALTMTDCIVTGNETGYGNGGGIYAGGNLTMTRCTVSHNTVADSSGVGGGGIYIHVTGTHTMTNCTVDHNTAEYGEGGGIYAAGTLTMTGGAVSENTATRSNGGGIYAAGQLIMTGGTVDRNSAQFNGNGGGIYIFTTGNLTMTGGAVTGNTTASGDGGGIYLESGTLNMTNVTLTGNEATVNKIGGGVYVNDGTFTMKGSSRITPSTGTDKNDVYLADGKMITVEDELSPAGGIAARITVSHFKYVTGTKVLDGSAVGTEYGKFTVTPKETGGETLYWEVDADGKLMRIVDGGKYPDKAWKALKDAVDAAQDGDVITIKGEIKATNASGNSGEITINKNLTIKGKTGSTSDILDANGNHASTPPSDVPSSPHRIFKITGTAQVHLENLTLQNGKDTTSAGTTGAGGGGIWMADTAHLTLTGVTIRNCTSKGPGGGLCMEHDGSTAGGTLTMKNSRVIDNTVKEDGAISTSSGGGICLPNFAYTAVIDTCEISRNTVDVSAKLTTAGAITVQACGLYTGNSSESKTHIKGHTIIDGNRYVKHTSKNTKVRGIGIWMQGGEVTIGESGKSDAESPLIQNHLVGNADSVEGTAIYLERSAVVNWQSGRITNNGGSDKAVYVKAGATFNNNGHTAN